MAEERSKKLIKLLVLSWAFVMILIGSLAFLLFLAFRDTSHSLREVNHQIVQLKSVEPVPGKDGMAGLSVIGPMGPAGPAGKDGVGRDGKDGMSTTTVIEKAIPGPPGPQGPQGLPAMTQRVPEFDGLGHYRYPGDDEWLPLFGAP